MKIIIKATQQRITELSRDYGKWTIKKNGAEISNEKLIKIQQILKDD